MVENVTQTIPIFDALQCIFAGVIVGVVIAGLIFVIAVLASGASLKGPDR